MPVFEDQREPDICSISNIGAKKIVEMSFSIIGLDPLSVERDKDWNDIYQDKVVLSVINLLKLFVLIIIRSVSFEQTNRDKISHCYIYNC